MATKTVTPEITEIPAKDRRKLDGLISERAVLGYAFSYKRLLKVLLVAGMDEAEAKLQLESCIEAVDDKGEKKVKSVLNDAIGEMLLAHEMDKVATVDPFGSKIRASTYSSSGSTLVKTKLIEKAPSFGISTNKIMELIDAATDEYTFATVSITRVKEDED